MLRWGHLLKKICYAGILPAGALLLKGTEHMTNEFVALLLYLYAQSAQG